jgi:hypothetical protein
MTKPAIGVVLLAAVLVGALTQAGTHTVIGRGVFTLLPGGEVGVRKGLNKLLWERDGYGPAAIQMVREHPVAGVGTGAFHTVVHDYGTLLGYNIPQDNGASSSARCCFRACVVAMHSRFGCCEACWSDSPSRRCSAWRASRCRSS